MSETAFAVYIDTISILNYNDFLNFVEKTQPDEEIYKDEIKEVYNNIVTNRVYSSGGSMYERFIIELFKRYIISLNGFVFSEIGIGGWDPVICLLSKDPIEKPKGELENVS